MAFFMGTFISLFAQIVSLSIFIRAIISWFPIGGEHPFVVVLMQITDPILIPLRRVIPTIGMVDLTPMIAIILLNVVADFARSLVVTI